MFVVSVETHLSNSLIILRIKERKNVLCQHCENRKDIKINPSPLEKEKQPDTAILMNKGIILLKRNEGFGYIQINYCPVCGREL